MKGTIAETTQTFTKMLTLGLNKLYALDNVKVSIFVRFGLFQFCCSRPLTSKGTLRYGNKSLPIMTDSHHCHHDDHDKSNPVSLIRNSQTVNKLMSVFHASVLLLIMNFVITL